VVFEHGDVLVLGDGSQQRPLNLAPGDIFRVKDAALRVATLSSRWPRLSRSENFMPSCINSLMRAGPSSTMPRTMASLQSPAPASRVSRTWLSNESSSLVTAAMPPWA